MYITIGILHAQRKTSLWRSSATTPGTLRAPFLRPFQNPRHERLGIRQPFWKDSWLTRAPIVAGATTIMTIITAISIIAAPIFRRNGGLFDRFVAVIRDGCGTSTRLAR